MSHHRLNLWEIQDLEYILTEQLQHTPLKRQRQPVCKQNRLYGTIESTMYQPWFACRSFNTTHISIVQLILLASKTLAQTEHDFTLASNQTVGGVVVLGRGDCVFTWTGQRKALDHYRKDRWMYTCRFQTKPWLLCRIIIAVSSQWISLLFSYEHHALKNKPTQTRAWGVRLAANSMAAGGPPKNTADD